MLAQAITSSGTGTKVTAVTSNGSQDNIEQMDMNTRQLGFVQSDVMSYAYDGTNLFEGMPITNFSTVAALYMEQVQIVTCNPDIKTVADLKGKTVSIGAAGSGVFYNALDILGAYGLDYETDINAQYQDFGDSADALRMARLTRPSWWPVPPLWPSPLWLPPRMPIWSAWTTSTLPPCRRPLPITAST